MRTPTATLTFIILVVVLRTMAVVEAQSPQPTLVAPPTASAKRLQPYVSVTSVFDTNIDHDKRDVDAIGGVLGAGIYYRNNAADPDFEVNAEVAGHSYSNSSRWDRLSQKVNASYERDLPGRWSFDTTGEISLKGSSEDRELSDQYVVIPRIAYRLSSQTRARVYGALRARRYDDDPGRNAFNRYVGVEFIERVATNRRWEVDLRYEVNDTDNARQHYQRWTFGTAYTFVVAGTDRVDVEVRYRMQRYPFRLVDVDDTDVQRRDQRGIPRITWTHPLRPNLDLRAGYVRETRFSNDPDREFTADLISLTLLRRW